ncbi:MAG: hypothetical protein LBG19_01910 [Prevotellaceae bacterium]|jgi:hypothetical protein|nr:hypothetical protein [Prevotellaceae bacterium]
MRKVGKYFCEVSVVIIGVTLTLMATSWINSCSEKKDLRLYLDAVKLELEDNLNMLQKAEEYIDKTLQLSEYLALNESEKHSRDSLKKYKSITQSFYFFVYKTEAFDRFKIS